MIPCSYRASACVAVLPSCVTSYVVSVRQARGLPVVSLFPHPASFGFHLTVDTLAFGCILPTTGRIRDFHPLETCAAGRTDKNRDTIHGCPCFTPLNHSDGRYDLSPLLSSRSERMWYPVVRRSAPRTRIRNGLEVWPVLWSGSKGWSMVAIQIFSVSRRNLFSSRYLKFTSKGFTSKIQIPLVKRQRI